MFVFVARVLVLKPFLLMLIDKTQLKHNILQKMFDQCFVTQKFDLTSLSLVNENNKHRNVLLNDDELLNH